MEAAATPLLGSAEEQCMGKWGCFPPGKASSHRTALPFFLSLCVQCFRVSVIHRTLTWTTGSLTCVRDHCYTCVYTHGGFGHTDSESAQHFDSGKTLTRFSCAPDGVRTSGLWISAFRNHLCVAYVSTLLNSLLEMEAAASPFSRKRSQRVKDPFCWNGSAVK